MKKTRGPIFNVPGGARSADQARQGQEPVAERGRALGRAPVPLRFHGARLLHRALRGVPRDRGPVSALLGPRVGAAAGASQVSDPGVALGTRQEELSCLGVNVKRF